MMTTITPPPPVEHAQPSIQPPEPASRTPWWRRGWVLALALLAVGLIGLGIYAASQPNEREQLIEDLTEDGPMSEAEAEEWVTELEGSDFFSEALDNVTPNDGRLSDVEIELIRKAYTALRNTMTPEAAGVLPELEYTDEQIRAYTAKVCAIAEDAESQQDFDMRLATEVLLQEADPLGVVTLVGGGAACSCDDVSARWVRDRDAFGELEATTFGYALETKIFITVNAEVEDFVGADLTDAACDEPVSTDVGTEYSCEGSDADGNTWDFEVTINAVDEFLITDITRR